MPLPRLPLPLEDVDRLFRAAAKQVAEARGDAGRRRVFEAEQTELLVRLAADSGARRGELAALKTMDLDGRVLHVCRNISGRARSTTPKSHQYRSLTLGTSTVELWRAHVVAWPSTRARTRLVVRADPDAGDVRAATWPGRTSSNASALSPASPTRHCTGSATPWLWSWSARASLLAAQHRLGHRDLSTTLRHYGWAQPPDDVDIANYLDLVLSTKIDSPTGEYR